MLNFLQMDVILVIDRLDGRFAICDDRHGGEVRLAVSLLPEGAREGDGLFWMSGAFHIDAAFAPAARKSAARRLDALVKRSERRQ